MLVTRSDGEELDAEFGVTEHSPAWQVVLESQGGGRNRDYAVALQLLLERLAGLGAILTDCRLATARVRTSLDMEGYSYPIDMGNVSDLVALRRALSQSMARTGQEPGASGGNPSKRLMLEVSLEGRHLSRQNLADFLAGLPSSIDTTSPGHHSLIGLVQGFDRGATVCSFSAEHRSHTLLSALVSKRFTLLSGLAGSGKTKVGQALAAWLCLPRHNREESKFSAGDRFSGPNATYLVKAADDLGIEVWNSDDPVTATRIFLPTEIIEEWISCIQSNGIDESRPSIEIRDLVQGASRWSNQMHSFHAPLKAAAFALQRLEPTVQVSRSAVIPVGADWTGSEFVLGFPDALDTCSYVSKPVLETILDAIDRPAEPHFLILDEMNLSHVERYFAEVLSAMESGESIPLYEGLARNANGRTVPHRLKIPDNLFVIGTVNVDETTYMFSPKVLDRAHVIEFRMEESEMERFLANNVKPDLTMLVGKGAAYAEAFVEASRRKECPLPDAVAGTFQAEMSTFFKALQAHGAEFGYRTAHDAQRFLHFYHELGEYEEGDTDWLKDGMDCVIVQKFLPKLHGSRAKLGPVLKSLWALCHNAPGSREQTSPEPSRDAAREAYYPLSADKIARMWKMLMDNGFASFAEA